MPSERLPINALQTAVYSTLNGDTTVTGVGPVYDYVPEQQARPYHVISEFSIEGDRTKGARIMEIVATVEAFSDAKGYQQVNGMLDVVLDLLTTAELSLASPWEMTGPGILTEAGMTTRMGSEGRTVKHGFVSVLWRVYQP